MNLIFKDYTKLDEKELVSILELRNQKKIREYMINNEIISLENHLNWIESLKKSTDKKYFAIFDNKQIIGNINFTELNKDNSNGFLGLYFDENINPSISSLSMYLFLEYFYDKLKLNTLNLEVLTSNLQAYNFDLSFGFIVKNRILKLDNEYYEMYMTKEMWENKKNSIPFMLLRKKIDKIEYKFEE